MKAFIKYDTPEEQAAAQRNIQLNTDIVKFGTACVAAVTTMVSLGLVVWSIKSRMK